MAEENNGITSAGAALVLRHQRVLWWVFAVNFLLGGLGASGAAATLHRALGHSLAGRELYRRFDVGMFFELVDQPDVNLFRSAPSSFIFAVLFLLFMLFVNGGILAVYFEDRKLTTGEFFGASGGFFWRFVRLMLWSLIPFGIVHFLFHGFSTLSKYVDDRALADQTGFYIDLLGAVIVGLLFLWVRMWFDVAQVRAVVLNERATRRSAWAALKLASRRLGGLYGTYFLIGLLTWMVTLIALLVWTKLPPTAVPVTFVLLELIMIVHIGGRLWQKASATVWYKRNPEPVPVVTEPAPPDLAAVSYPEGTSEVDRSLESYVEPPPAPAEPPAEPPVLPEEPPTKLE